MLITSFSTQGFLVLGLVMSALSTSANTYITVNNHCKERNMTSQNLNNCTNGNNASKCSLNLNDLEEMLSSLSSLTILFENSSDAFPLYTSLAFHDFTQLELRGASEQKTVVKCLHLNKSGLGIGLTFTNVSNFLATNIVFETCGCQYNLTKIIKSGKILWSALTFENCENVQLLNVTVKESSGFGVSMFDVIGNVHLEYCLFYNNSAIHSDIDTGGGGVYLEMSLPPDKNTSHGMYKLLNCSFIHNKAHTSKIYPGRNEVRTFGQGGGLLISFKGNTSSHHFSVLNCTFRNNTAVWGGGLHVFLTDSSHNNVITIEHSLFEKNEASAGGGGMVVYMLSLTSCIRENNVSVVSTNFARNRAKSQGGGTIIHSRHSDNSAYKSCNVSRDLKNVRGINHLRFESCKWIQNGASYSAAIDITTRATITESFLIEPVFSNCVFERNNVVNELLDADSLISKYKERTLGKAAFMVLGSVVKFENSVSFEWNRRSTALYAVTSRIEFSSTTNGTFYENSGRNGGAIALIGSILYVGDHSFLNFTQNRAYELGGAIYSETQGEHELHQNIPGLNCFIHCTHCETVTLSFNNNSANRFLDKDDIGYSFGRAIFATSILSCVSDETATEITNITTNVSALLERIANFKFVGSNPYDQVVTSAAKFTLSEPFNNLVIPGKDFKVPLVTTDFFGHRLQSDYKAFVGSKACKNGSVTIDLRHTYLPTNKLKLFGDPGAQCGISVEREGNQLFYLTFRIIMAQCPPGFILTENQEVSSGKFSRMDCVCAQQLANGTKNYRGISSCNDRLYKAMVLHHFWVGYESDSVTSHDNLITSFCPRSFCSYNSSSYSHEYVLPKLANKLSLDEFICSNGRTGKICGSCQVNYSVYIHSPNFLCKKNHLCSVGWLFYLFSEIVPLIILFTVIICFNISFTSGTLNGFILYAQTIDILSVSARNHRNVHSTWTVPITKAFIFAYDLFNLNFFNLDSLSFCLFRGATTLDIISIKYVTIVLAFVLVISVFILMNLCTWSIRNKYYPKKLQLRQSVIHGISTVLVICFAQTFKVSFLIFSPGFVFSRGDRIASYQVLYNGNLQLFGSEHLKYVIPGLVLFIFIVIIPTFFLMYYPLGSKILFKCGINETKITKLNQIFCITRLRPIFDSFQSCYKDKYRCFAGLYFIYRILILASSSYSYGATQFYVLIQIQLSLMLLIHCLAHPYIKVIHNTLDTLLFINIAIINGLSIFLHTKSKQPLYSTSVSVASGFQTFLIGLPLITLLLYIVTKIVSKLKNCQPKTEVIDVVQKNPIEEDIPFRLLHDGQDFETVDNDLCEF